MSAEALAYYEFTRLQDLLMIDNDKPVSEIDPMGTLSLIGMVEEAFSNLWDIKMRLHRAAEYSDGAVTFSLYEAKMRMNTVLKLAQYRVMKRLAPPGGGVV